MSGISIFISFCIVIYIDMCMFLPLYACNLQPGRFFIGTHHKNTLEFIPAILCTQSAKGNWSNEPKDVANRSCGQKKEEWKEELQVKDFLLVSQYSDTLNSVRTACTLIPSGLFQYRDKECLISNTRARLLSCVEMHAYRIKSIKSSSACGSAA